MFESHIDIAFIYQEDPETSLSRILNVLDTTGEYDYTKLSSDEILLDDELNGCSIILGDRERHLFQYNDDIIKFIIQCENLTWSSDGRERLGAAFSFVTYVYAHTDPQYVFGMHDWRAERIPKDPDEFNYALPSPITDEGLARNWINHPTWLMIFPPELVEVYGREWLLNLPAETVEELDDGAIMTVATESILDCQSDTEIAQEIGDAMEPIEQRFQQRDI